MKIDAIPGRLNEDWILATRKGIYYGQCSELCGKDHAFMPIEVHLVDQEDFDAWAAKIKTATAEEARDFLYDNRDFLYDRLKAQGKSADGRVTSYPSPRDHKRILKEMFTLAGALSEVLAL